MDHSTIIFTADPDAGATASATELGPHGAIPPKPYEWGGDGAALLAPSAAGGSRAIK